MKRLRTRFIVTAAAMLAVAAAGLEAQDLSASRPAGDSPGGTGADVASAAAPCTGCPVRVGNCTLVSCNPCCYRCPGYPYLLCIIE
jgi:hypothetical protein